MTAKISAHRELFCVCSCVAVLFIVLCIHSKADAQMTTGYPKRFELTGLIELYYTDFKTDLKAEGRRTLKTGATTFGQRLRLEAKGYIYHPRLAVFDASVGFSNEKRDAVTIYKQRNMNYNLSVVFLPFRPVSLTMYALRSDYKGEESKQGEADATTMQYGAYLRIVPRDFRYISSTKLAYDHMESEPFTFSKNLHLSKTVFQRWDFDLYGGLSKIHTYYGINVSLSDLSYADVHEKNKNLSVFSDTLISKIATLANSVQYADDTSNSILTFRSALYFKPRERFNHEYQYIYQDSKFSFKGSDAAGIEASEINQKTQQMMGSWSYRITSWLNSGLSLNYNLHEENNLKWTSYGISPSLRYQRPIFAGIDFFALYRLLYKKDEERGDLNEQYLEASLQTRKMRLGTLYLNYYFTKTHQVDKIRIDDTETDNFSKSQTDATVHVISIGIRGNFRGIGTGRAYWNLEGEFSNQQVERKRDVSLLAEGDDFSGETDILQSSRRTKQFTFAGDLLYPLRKGSTIQLKSGYTFGQADSRDIKQFYYEGRLTYPVFGRLILSAWLKDFWSKQEGFNDRRTRDIELNLRYRWARIFLDLVYDVELLRESDVEKYYRRIYLVARRTFG
jgi:hypothetical protein